MKTRTKEELPEKNRIPLELYFHIPFCVKKCAYCDFLSMEAGEETKEFYMKCLQEDVMQFPQKEAYLVTSVFIGGGTPTVVRAEAIEELLGLVKSSFSFAQDAEITIEANPKTVRQDSLLAYRRAGINRISFGLQSVHTEELKRLGRIHSYEDFRESLQMAREAGFRNINLDLMFAFPGQTIKSWRETLEEAAKLDVPHISAYSLIVEEGTPFYTLYGEDIQRRERGERPKALPTEEAELEMYQEAVRILKRYGYQSYEISNFAKEGYACRHNEGYWSGVLYAGFGLGAASYMENRRFVKTRCLKEYLAGDFSEREIETLSDKERMEEFMILGLRKSKGVSIGEFEKRFQGEMPEAYRRIIDVYKSRGLLQEEDGRIFFTERGIFLSNIVMAEFMEIL